MCVLYERARAICDMDLLLQTDCSALDHYSTAQHTMAVVRPAVSAGTPNYAWQVDSLRQRQ